MTNEEAIGILEDVRDAICDNIPGNHAELDELREAVRMATGALRERKTGDWIIEPHEVEGMFFHRCSECMSPVMITSKDRRVYNYCPFCGADMRGGNER